MSTQAESPVIATAIPQFDEEEETEITPDSLWWERQRRLRSSAAAVDTNPLEVEPLCGRERSREAGERERAGEILSERGSASRRNSEASDDQQDPDRPNRPLSVSPLDQQTQQTTTATDRRLGDRRRDRAAQVKAAHQSPRCAHVRASGVRCGSPALRDSAYCYYHDHFHGGPRLIYPALAKLDDPHGIQTALMEVLTGILDGRLEHKTGALLLYGLQTAVANLKRMADLDPEEVVTEIPAGNLPSGAEGEAPNADETAAAEHAAAADAARSTLEQIEKRHRVPCRPSGDPARDGKYAELMANYYQYDPHERHIAEPSGDVPS